MMEYEDLWRQQPHGWYRLWVMLVVWARGRCRRG